MTTGQAWTYLLIAGVFEICLAVGLKLSDGFTRLMPTIFTAVSGVISFFFLAKTIKALPIGTAYAVWTGIGACGTVVVGSIVFGEAIGVARLACVSLVVAGVVGLKVIS